MTSDVAGSILALLSKNGVMEVSISEVVKRVSCNQVIMANLVGGFDSKPEEKDVAVQEGLQNVSSPSSPQTPQGGDKLNVYSPTSSRWTRLLTPRGTPILNRIEHLELQVVPHCSRYHFFSNSEDYEPSQSQSSSKIPLDSNHGD